MHNLKPNSKWQYFEQSKIHVDTLKFELNFVLIIWKYTYFTTIAYIY